MIERVRPLTGDLVLVGPNRPGYDQFGVPLVADSTPGIGPLGAIAAALTNARHEACLVVACDMPFLNPELLRHMAELPRASYDALVPHIPADPAVPDAPPVYQTLHAIYQKSCLMPIQRRLAKGSRRVTDFYPDIRLRSLPESEVRPYDPELRSFFGLNTPEAVQRAQIWLAGSSQAG